MRSVRTVDGEKIRHARHRQGMTQLSLAQAVGVSERNIVRWENGHNAPRADHLAAVAKATGQEIEFFYSGAEEVVSPNGDPFRGPNGASASGDRNDGGGRGGATDEVAA